MDDGYFTDSLITRSEIVAALKTGTPPSAVVICGCDSAQLLPDAIKAGVSVAFGIGPEDEDIDLPATIASVNCSAVADAVTGALVAGETIDEAVRLGTAAINTSLPDQNPVKAVAWCADDVDSTLSLAGNGLL